MGSHSVTCHPAAVTFPPLPQPKLVHVLDLATPEGCKAEFSWVVVISQDSLLAKYGHIYLKNQAVSSLGIEPVTESCKPTSDHYTTKLGRSLFNNSSNALVELITLILAEETYETYCLKRSLGIQQ